MTKVENRCANCGGKFGLVYHHHWGLRFCRKACKDDFLAKTARMRTWFGRAASSCRQSAQAKTGAESSGIDMKSSHSARHTSLTMGKHLLALGQRGASFCQQTRLFD